MKKKLKKEDDNLNHLGYEKTPEDLKSELQTYLPKDKNISDIENIVYVTSILSNLYNSAVMDQDTWNNINDKYLFVNDDKLLSEIKEKIYNYFVTSIKVKEDVFEDTEEGKNLYKGEFSLAYGALTLLNNTNLHLKQNRFYGLLGPNNCGKTTLMRAIANEQEV